MGFQMSTNSIAAITGGPIVPPVPGGGFRSAVQESLTLVAAQLGMSVSDLRAHMQFGKTPADVAAERGVSQSALLGVVKESISSSVMSPPSGNTLDTLANKIVNLKATTGGQRTANVRSGEPIADTYVSASAETDRDSDDH